MLTTLTMAATLEGLEITEISRRVKLLVAMCEVESTIKYWDKIKEIL